MDADDLPYSFCYSSNLSLKRRFQAGHGLWFDEDFTYAMGEDAEFAYRARAEGFRLRYQPDALAFHDHPTSLAGARARYRTAAK